MSLPLKILLTLAGIAPEDGGPSRSVPALALALAGLGAQVEIITCEAATGQAAPLVPDVSRVKTHLLPRHARDRIGPVSRNEFSRATERLARVGETVLHDNGLWLPSNHAVAAASRRLSCPRLVSPRGMLTAWSFQFRGWKKRLAWWLYQQRDLQSAQVLHATSAQEAAEFRQLGLKAPIALIPNGVALPSFPGFSIRNPSSLNSKTALFLSRIHPKKGLFDLLQAWAQVRPAGWRLQVVGPSENGHRQELERAAQSLGLDQTVAFGEAVSDQDKWALYRGADLFVLPSHSENFGIVVAEALAAGLPVITTRGTPWEDLVSHQCGWWTEIGSKPLAEALRDATQRPDGERRAMGERGRQLVAAKYGWPGIAAQVLAVYAWMLGHGPKPETVLEKS